MPDTNPPEGGIQEDSTNPASDSFKTPAKNGAAGIVELLELTERVPSAAELRLRVRRAAKEINRTKTLNQLRPVREIITDFDCPVLHPTLADMQKKLAYWMPEIAFGTVICFAGAVFGRKYRTVRNLRTNIMAVGLADTGEGKSETAKYVFALAESARLSQFIGSQTVKSGQGLMHELMQNPSQIMVFDEFGEFLQKIGSKKNLPQHLQMVIENILTLYSKADQLYTEGFKISDQEAVRSVLWPNLCVFGISTEESYVNALDGSDFKTGFLNRFITFGAPGGEAEYKRALDRIDCTEPAESVISLWTGLMQGRPSDTDKTGRLFYPPEPNPDITTVPFEDTAFYSDFEEKWLLKKRADKENAGVWARGNENSLKIALIVAILRDPQGPVITNKDLTLAGEIVMHTCRKMLNLKDSVENNTQSGKNFEKIRKIIYNAGGSIQLKDITLQTKGIVSAERRAVLRDLTEAGLVVESVEEIGYRNQIRVFYEWNRGGI